MVYFNKKTSNQKSRLNAKKGMTLCINIRNLRSTHIQYLNEICK